MNHIKTFEGLFDLFKKKRSVKHTTTKKVEVLFEPIGVDAANEWLRAHNKLEFTIVEIEEILLLFPNMTICVAKYTNIVALVKTFNAGTGCRYPGGVVRAEDTSSIIDTIYQIDIFTTWLFGNIEFHIIKFADEWYMINFTENYVLCDTFDGVLQFMVNKEWKKYSQGNDLQWR